MVVNENLGKPNIFFETKTCYTITIEIHREGHTFSLQTMSYVRYDYELGYCAMYVNVVEDLKK